MEKAIGAQELVYAKIIDFVPQKTSVSIIFKHGSGKQADHCYSKDKDKHKHCYRDLEEGQNYIIVTEHVGKKRWVWKKAILVSKKEQDLFREIAGLCPTPDEMVAAMQALRDHRDPPIPPTLADLMTF